MKLVTKNDEEYLFIIKTFGENYETHKYYKAWLAEQEKDKVEKQLSPRTKAFKAAKDAMK